ncbi:glycoside hydrolase family 95 protein [Lysobacter sp. SG-8]|uniref:Glycoside hydrolase family 95 protein n=1 Tax=Marilutibacter penaei TaxID=2759900 RepID=A0A7W3YE29_9GAMM|nr:glycoside hydrolase family 95 protein [Lysobacter penaei]MBB1087781.1 glycoside hydrolase family 95 protein [Lysobacter penaei]
MFDRRRRRLMQAALAAAAIRPGVGAAVPIPPTSPMQPADLVLRYRVPARQWEDALPLGNGRLGAMAWGGIARERLQLNEDTLFAGGPYDAINPEARDALPEVRRLIFEGRYADAERLADETMMSRPLRMMPYQCPGEVWIDFDGMGGIDDYTRQLDLDEAIARCSFRAGDVRHEREVFVSAVDDCVVMRHRCDRDGGLDGFVSITSELPHAFEADGAELLLRGRNGSRHGVEGALRHAMRVRLEMDGGTVRVEEGRLRFEGARSVLLRIAVATSHRGPRDVSGDPEALTAATLDAAVRRPFVRMRDEHLADHRALFRRVSIDLGRTAAADRSTEQRIDRFATSHDPALAALYYQYGRYLLIASSRPGSQPANLQGIWNDLRDPPWGSKWTLNINAEMNYWPAEAGALPECVEPLERMIAELAEAGTRTAQEMYGAPGWVVHHNTDLWRQTGPIDGARFGLWPMGGAWLLRHLWDRWDYSRDPDVLRRVYPLFKGAVDFYRAVLVEDPATGELVTNPSLSPENPHPHGASLCAGPAMDSQLLRDLFAQCAAASRILDVDHGLAEALEALSARLPEDRIGKSGQLQEWREDWDLEAPEPQHRHVSHLYALYPSDRINRRDTPALAKAARRSLELRGDDATGWGIGWRINLWARLGEGARAYEVLEKLLSHARSYPNLFDAHPPFQIDGNFGGAAGIMETIVQDWGAAVFLLPALPARWPRGRVQGLRLRGDASLDLAWDGGVLEDATIRTGRGGRWRFEHAGAGLDLDLPPGGRAVIAPGSDGRLVRRA